MSLLTAIIWSLCGLVLIVGFILKQPITGAIPVAVPTFALILREWQIVSNNSAVSR